MTSTLPFGWNQNKWLLICGNILLGIVLIILSNNKLLPLSDVNFIFFAFIAFLFALYRPGWAFLFLVGMLPFEIFNLLPPEIIPLSLRPYQALTFLLFAALLVRFCMRKLPFALFGPRWFDALPLCMVGGAYFAALNAPSPPLALKQALILTSFLLLYFVVRIFLQSREDIRQTLPFFLSSSLIVLGYAVWQNIRFSTGQENFAVMLGRPNATFSEADWLGMFLLLVLVTLWVLFWQNLNEKQKSENTSSELGKYSWQRSIFLILIALQVLTFMGLIITVSRSAWLGAFLGAFAFWGGLFLVYRHSFSRLWFRTLIFFTLTSLATLGLALMFVNYFHLTSFSLSDRALSTASGLQKITVSCTSDVMLPEQIAQLSALDDWGCRHIYLEEISKEKMAGRFVKEIFQPDPNVGMRARGYGQVWSLIQEHPIIGIGWGSVATFLGSDARGAGLNASNVFLEVWLGSGLIGFLAFIIFWFALASTSLHQLFLGEKTEQFFSLWLFSSWVALTVFDLFNSGILLGFFFLYLAVGALALQQGLPSSSQKI